jgi:hypothetical protein
MTEFIMLMHDDAAGDAAPDMWDSYLSSLRGRGAFDGGSAIGAGRTFRKQGAPRPVSERLRPDTSASRLKALRPPRSFSPGTRYLNVVGL